MFSEQAQDIYSLIPINIRYVTFHSQNILLYICRQYINILSHALQQNIFHQFNSIYFAFI